MAVEDGGEIKIALDDDDGQLPLDLAWRYKFDEGELRVTWDAMAAYGLRPIKPVLSGSDESVFSPQVWKFDIPGVSISLISPEERAIAETILSEDRYYVNGRTYTSHPGRIDVTLDLGFTSSAPLDQQARGFEELYDAEWESRWRQHMERPDAFSYLSSHAIARACGSLSAIGINKFYDAKVPQELVNNEDDELVLMVIDEEVGSQVATAVHGLFCDEVCCG